MATQFSEQQTQGLEAASKRIAEGSANQTDIANVNYAKSKGWSPLAAYTPKAEGTIDTSKLSETKINESDLGSSKTGMDDFAKVLASAGGSSIDRFIMDTLEQQRKVAEQEKNLQQQRYDEAMTGVKESQKMATQLTEQTARKREELDARIKELNSLQDQIRYNEEKYKTEIGIEESKPILASAIDGNKTIISKQFAAQTAGLYARAAIIKDNIELAGNIFNDYFNKTNQLNQQQANTYNSLLGLANNNIISLKKEEKDAINSKLNILQDEQAEINAKKDSINKMIMSNPAAFAAAKITPDMSYEQIISKMSTPQSVNAIADVNFVAELRNTYPDAGIVLTDTAAQAQMKLAKSAIYREKTRIPSAGGGGETAPMIAPSTDLEPLLSLDPTTGLYGANPEIIATIYGQAQRPAILQAANEEARKRNEAIKQEKLRKEQAATTPKKEWKGLIPETSYGGKSYLPEAIGETIYKFSPIGLGEKAYKSTAEFIYGKK